MNFIAQESPQKLRGGYYTPPDLAAFLTRWVLEARPRRILEPACGAGVFLHALAQREPAGLEAVVGCECDPIEASKARRAGSMRNRSTHRLAIHTTDFLRWALARLDVPQFDAALGNPPFIRYQYLDAAQQQRAEDIFSRLGLPFTRHTNAWVPFVIAALALLRPAGRLAMVVPAELLHVLHARGLRRFLLQECSRLLVLDPEDLWFDDTLQGTVLLLAEKRSAQQAGPGKLAIVPVPARAALRGSATPFWRSADFVDAAALDGKWMPALLTRSERALLGELHCHPLVRRFGDVASVDVGIVTGANQFFLVDDATVAKFDLGPFAHPMFGRSDHVGGVIYDAKMHAANRRSGLPANFLWFHDTPRAELPPGARRYLRLGEAQGLHRRYKCRIRTPWYRVPSVSAAPVAMLKRSHHFPRLVLNRAAAFTTDTAYRIRPNNAEAESLVFGFVNSLTALTCELEGRHYGGGVLELVPSEIERLLVPLVHGSRSDLAHLDLSIQNKYRPEDILAHQDQISLAALGFTPARSNILCNAWSRLRCRRHRRGDIDLTPTLPAVGD